MEHVLQKVMHLPEDIEIRLADSMLKSHFDPINRVIRTDYPISPGILAHEMGHASGLAAKRPLWHAIPIGGKILGMPAAAASLIAQAYTDPGSTATKAWRYAPAALLTPTILEEIRASSRALQGLYRAGGKGAMLKGLLPLVPALGTYLAAAGLPIFGGKLVQHYSSR